jgi:hypothetical protein
MSDTILSCIGSLNAVEVLTRSHLQQFLQTRQPDRPANMRQVRVPFQVHKDTIRLEVNLFQCVPSFTSQSMCEQRSLMSKGAAVLRSNSMQIFPALFSSSGVSTQRHLMWPVLWGCSQRMAK